jgi:hypothetical protein
LKNNSYAALPSAAVRAAAAECIERIKEAELAHDNAALDREIAKRAKGWLWGIGAERWTREDARRYFDGFTGLDACFNPLWHYPSDQLVTAQRLLRLADAAIASDADVMHVTASDFRHISGFYGVPHA